ncbi:MAG: hypothetical protein AAGJ82_15050 [Bacteroidota bacterium]
MISRFRLQIDGWVQLCLGLVCLLGWYGQWYGLLTFGLVLLWLWQTGSALEFWLDYRHHARRWYLWLGPLALVVFLSWGYGWIFLLLFSVTYGWHTLHDYRIVLRRPRSFWEL